MHTRPSDKGQRTQGEYVDATGGRRPAGGRGGPWGGGWGGGPRTGGAWGFEGSWGPGGGRGGRRRMRRGDIRRAVLLALADGPANGYEVMSRLETRTGGMWRPSPGSVYPTLQMLEDEGLARSESRDGQRIYSLTEEGQSRASADATGAGGAPWDAVAGGDEGARSLRQGTIQLLVAAKQIAHAGTADQVQRATDILNRARKELYGLLAEG